VGIVRIPGISGYKLFESAEMPPSRIIFLLKSYTIQILKFDFMEKKITTKKHGDTLMRLMQVTRDAANKYLTIDNDDNTSQKKRTQ